VLPLRTGNDRLRVKSILLRVGCISAEMILVGESVGEVLIEFMILYDVVEFLLVNAVLLSYDMIFGIAALWFYDWLRSVFF